MFLAKLRNIPASKILFSLITLFFCLCFYAEISFIIQIKFFFFTFICTLAGSFVIGRHRTSFANDIFFCIIAFLTGSALTLLISFTLYHRVVMKFLSLSHIVESSFITFAVLLIMAIPGYLKYWHKTTFITPDLSLIAKIFAIALFAWSAAYLGMQTIPYKVTGKLFHQEMILEFGLTTREVFYQKYKYDKEQDLFILRKDRIPSSRANIEFYHALLSRELNADKRANWGFGLDKVSHLGQTPYQITHYNLPPSRAHHLGLGVLALTNSSFIGFNLNEEELYHQTFDTSKLLVFIFVFTFIYLFYFLTIEILNVPKKHLHIVLLSAIFFAPIMLPLKLDATWISFNALTRLPESFFYNITHLFSMAFAFACTCLLFLNKQKKIPLFLLGCFLTSASFFIKPSAFVVLAPSIYLIAFLDLIKYKKISKDQLYGLLTLLLIPIFFWTYNHFAAYKDIAGFGSSMQIRMMPFAIWTHKFINTLPTTSDSLNILHKFLQLFPALIIVLIYKAQNLSRESLNLTKLINENRITIFLTSCLMIGLFVGIAFLEYGPGILQVNLAWVLGSGYILFLPLLLRSIFEIEGRFGKIAKLQVILHISFGIGFLLNFFVFFNF